MNILFFDFVWLKHLEYYKYLLLISWPALSGLFIIYVCFGFKLISEIRKALAQGVNSFPTHLVKIGKSLTITVMIVVSYSVMFINSYPDWFLKPAVITGIVESINQDDIMTVRGGEELYRVKASRNMMTGVKLNDLIEVVYLPKKLDTVKCKLLTQQASDFI